MYDLALRATGGDPVLNLALEESLMDRGFGARSALLLYVDDPCVVVGRNQNPWVEIAASAASSALPVLRRVSGGGAVYHDRGNLNWSLIVPRSEHDPREELGRVASALRRLGVDSESGPRGGLFVVAGPWKSCKLSGTARRLAADRVIHHGTLLVDADLARLSSSLGGIDALCPPSLRSVRSRSVNLSSLVPGLSLEEAALAIARELTGREPEGADSYADPRARDDAARRLASWEWTWGATPAFSLALGWSGGEARVDVRGGRVAGSSGPGSESLEFLIGRRFDYALPDLAVAALEGGGRGRPKRPPPRRRRE
jgi:lipoate-protein ligase A